MKVATHTRISTDEERQPFSLEAQGDRLSAYIASQDGWHLVRSFTDQQYLEIPRSAPLVSRSLLVTARTL
jgi:hypothetical protein